MIFIQQNICCLCRGGAPGFVRANNFPVANKFFLAFKGKRYLHGIGSDTRNSLHHLHNNRDVVMVSQPIQQIKHKQVNLYNSTYSR